MFQQQLVRDALARPFVDEPGGAMLYSTGSTHLLSAILARASGQSTHALAREWLGRQQGFVITGWDRDPQGVHLGGNNMAMDTRSLLAFGELYRNGGVATDGRRLLSQEWIDASWTPRTQSRHTGDGYGYGWFLRDTRRAEPVRYAWGIGRPDSLRGHPRIGLTVAMTSDDSAGSARSGHRDALHGLMAEIIRSSRAHLPARMKRPYRPSPPPLRRGPVLVSAILTRGRRGPARGRQDAGPVTGRKVCRHWLDLMRKLGSAAALAAEYRRTRPRCSGAPA